MSRSRLFSALASVALIEQASAGAIQTPECTKDMLSVDSSFEETRSS
jgi:hypothetical protein